MFIRVFILFADHLLTLCEKSTNIYIFDVVNMPTGINKNPIGNQ